MLYGVNYSLFICTIKSIQELLSISPSLVSVCFSLYTSWYRSTDLLFEKNENMYFEVEL